jgi:hypothetical protein
MGLAIALPRPLKGPWEYLLDVEHSDWRETKFLRGPAFGGFYIERVKLPVRLSPDALAPATTT